MPSGAERSRSRRALVMQAFPHGQAQAERLAAGNLLPPVAGISAIRKAAGQGRKQKSPRSARTGGRTMDADA